MRPLASALSPARRVCRICFDPFPVYLGSADLGLQGAQRCARCRVGPPPRPGELEATRRFWVRNPTMLHLRAFEAWDDAALAAEARRHLWRFQRRAARRWASLDRTALLE